MLKNFKIRIALWYAGLFTIIIAITLFSVYKIISYQLKEEIKLNLADKTSFIKRALIEEHNENSGHSDEKRSEHNFNSNENENKGAFNSNFNEVKAYTETADNNYALFIFSEKKLIYYTPRYQKISSHLSLNRFEESQMQYITIEGIPFYVSKISKSNNIFFIAYELSSLKNLQSRLLIIFLIVFPISLLLSIVCGFLVTQRSLNIIRLIDHTAQKITSHNLSERIQMNDSNDEISRLITTLNSMIDRLEKSFNQAKQFSQDAAHEIRTPLTIIQGEIEELILSEQSNTKTLSVLENVLEEVQYLSAISERLMMIHTIDTNNIKYHFKTINLTELLKDIYQDVKILSLEKNIKVHTNTLEGDVLIDGNKELLSRLFWNIADNAVKYNKVNGTIDIELLKKRSKVIIRVKDSGIGIPQSDISKIFNRFYRVDKSRARRYGGSGLGLSICKWIVKLHSGKIKVESQEGIGSVFTIEFNIKS